MFDMISFEKVLGDIGSAEKSVREEAERSLRQWRLEDRDRLFMLVLEALRSNSDEQVRLQSALLLRSLLNRSPLGGGDCPALDQQERDQARRDRERLQSLGNGSGWRAGRTEHNILEQRPIENGHIPGETEEEDEIVWRELGEQTQGTIKVALLNCLEQEPANRVRNTLCDVTAELAKFLLPRNMWPDFNNKLGSMVHSQCTNKQKASLRIFSEILPVVAHQFAANPDVTLNIVLNSLASPDAAVRFECMGFITSIVEDGNKKLWKRLTVVVPTILEVLDQMINTNNDYAGEFLQYLIRITDTNVLFLKPHLSLVVDKLMNIANSEENDDEYKQYAVEALLCIAEAKPKLAKQLPKYVQRMTELLMKFMLEIKDEKYSAWLDSGEEEQDEQRNYDLGEEGIDRLIKAFSELEEINEVINIVYAIVGDFLQRSEWQYRFVAIMTISQTVEYIPEDILEDHLDHIMKILLQHLKDHDRHVRFASCQGLGQISLDHQPYVQERYHNEVIPLLIETFDDEHHRVQSHAAAAFVNYCEEIQKIQMMPYVDTVMKKLLPRVKLQTNRLVREQAITAIAVVAAVTEESFMPYYSVVLPLIKGIIQDCLSAEERTCRGKAIECISIIGLSVGKNNFAGDAHEIMNAFLHITNAKMDDADPVKEYVQEALGRMCRAMEDDFVHYLPHIIPNLINILSAQPSTFNNTEAQKDENEDMTMVMLADNKCVGLKTSMIEDQERVLDLLSTCVEVLREKFRDWIAPVTTALLPLLRYLLSDDVKQKALNTMAELLDAAKAVAQEMNGDNRMLLAMLTNVADVVFKNLYDAHERENIDLEIMIAEATGLNYCLEKAGPGVLPPQTVKVFTEKLFKLLHQSTERRAQCSLRKHDDDVDEEEIENIDEEERQEQSLRTALVDVLGGLMEHHPDEFMSEAAVPCIRFIQANLQKSAKPDDRTLALYACDDILMSLGEKGVALWDSFMGAMLESIVDSDAGVRQAACYGIIQAAPYSHFAPFAQRAASNLLQLLNEYPSKSKDAAVAMDDAVAAIGDLVIHHEKHLADPKRCLAAWIDNLPLKHDEEEAQRVHEILVNLIQSNNSSILGERNENVPKLVSIMTSIYRSNYSNAVTDEKIRGLIGNLGYSYIEGMQAKLSKKQQKKVGRIFQDIQQQQAANGGPPK